MYTNYLSTSHENVSFSDIVIKRISDAYVKENDLSSVKDLLNCVSPANVFRGFWMVNNCPNVKNISRDIVDKCENTQHYDYNSMPVDYIVDGELKYTFQNIFCAICNNVDIRDTEYYVAEMHCENDNKVSITSNMSIKDITSVCRIQYWSKFMSGLRRCNSLLKHITYPNMSDNVSRTYHDRKTLCIYVHNACVVSERKHN